MPRARSPDRDKAFELWKKHKGKIKIKEIAEQLGVSKNLSVADGNIQINVITQTDAEIKQQKLSVIRSKRDELLATSDWTQFIDSPLTDEKKKDWQTYRQALRDMPDKGCTDLDNPIWPIKPV